MQSGQIDGQGAILSELCDLAEDGIPQEEVVWSLAVKAELVELVQSGPAFGLFCR